MKKLALAAIAPAAMIMTAAPAFADRDPTADERASIEEALRAEGFTSWEDIEMEDDGPAAWEVDDAVGADGREYDLELDPETLAITRRDQD